MQVHTTNYKITELNDSKRCNICGGPFRTDYLDDKKQKQTERIGCLGHIGVLPYMHTLTQENERYLQFLARRKQGR